MARLDQIISYAENCDVPTVITDGEILTTYVNRAFTELCGHTEEDLLGRKPGAVLRGPGSCEHSRRCFHEGLRHLLPFEVKVKNYRKGSGEEYIAGIYVLPVRDTTRSESPYYVALKRELASPEEEILSDGNFSKALSSVVDLVTGFGK